MPPKSSQGSAVMRTPSRLIKPRRRLILCVGALGGATGACSKAAAVWLLNVSFKPCKEPERAFLLALSPRRAPFPVQPDPLRNGAVGLGGFDGIPAVAGLGAGAHR